MKRIAGVGLIIVCCTALSHAASVPGRDSPLPDESADMDAMAVGLTNPAEQALHAVRIPEVVFAQAYVVHCIEFVQNAIEEHAPDDAKLTPRILFAPSAVCYLVGEVSDKSTGPLMTYGARNVSALHVIRLIERLFELRFVMNGDLVVVEKKPANKTGGR